MGGRAGLLSVFVVCIERPCRCLGAASGGVCRQPADAACMPHAAPMQERWLGGNASTALAGGSGGLFLRPCATTEAHMLDILRRQAGEVPRLPRPLALSLGQQQGDEQQQQQQQRTSGGPVSAEQEFLAWCVLVGGCCAT